MTLDTELSQLDIQSIIEINPNIRYLSAEEIIKKIELLKSINCNDNQIKNIIVANPWYLSNSIDKAIKLIQKLNSIGITNLNIVFDTNPNLLDNTSEEIDRLISKRKKENVSIDDIIDEICELSN